MSDKDFVKKYLDDFSNLVKPKEDIAEKILNVIQNDDMKKTLIRKGFNQVKKYSWEKSANKLINVINKMK